MPAEVAKDAEMMRAFCLLGLLVALGPVAAAETATPARKPNVLFIAVDDMNNDLACYGHPFVKSPNIDRLAARGVRFDKAYCQMPWCSPSRASLMTGLRPDTTRVMDLNYDFREGLPKVVTLPQAFRQAGYYAARVGKIYHYGNPGDIGTSGLDDPASWQEVVNPAGRDKTTLERDILIMKPTKGLGSSMSLLADKVGKDEEHTDGKVATEAIKLLEAHKDQPFFLAVGFYKPHCPWVAPQKWFDMYQLKDEVLPPITPAWKATVPAAALGSTSPWPYKGVTPEEARQCRLAYHATISFVDAQIEQTVETGQTEIHRRTVPHAAEFGRGFSTPDGTAVLCSGQQFAQIRAADVGLQRGARLRAFAAGLETLMCIEHKRPLIEDQARAVLYDLPAHARPRIIGKKDENGKAVAFEVKVGDKVLISKYGGTEVKLDGEKFTLVREDDILGVVG